jgi:hypothetical protein
MSRYDLRIQAYQFFQQILAQLPFGTPSTNQTQIIRLDDLVRLKTGMVDPTPALIRSLKQLFTESSIQVEIEALLTMHCSYKKNNREEP